MPPLEVVYSFLAPAMPMMHPIHSVKTGQQSSVLKKTFFHQDGRADIPAYVFRRLLDFYEALRFRDPREAHEKGIPARVMRPGRTSDI